MPENSWRDAPKDSIIIGLKELPVETCRCFDISGCYGRRLMPLKFPWNTYTYNLPTVISNRQDGKKSSPDFLEEMVFS